MEVSENIDHVKQGVKSVELQANQTGVPAYLKEHVVQRVANRQTRSAALPLLSVPRLTTEFARRFFS